MTLIVERTTRRIVGLWGDGREDPTKHDRVEVPLAAFAGLPDGEKYLNGDGTVRCVPTPPTAEQTQDAADVDAARQGIAALVADIERLDDATVTLTAAQLRAHLAHTDRALVALLRHSRRREQW